MLGGTNLTIRGDGFTNNTVVMIDDSYYTNGTNGTRITYEEISISTLPCTEGTSVIRIYVNGTRPIQNTTVNFECSSKYTPVITSIEPTEITGPGIIILTGYNFGNTLNIIIDVKKKIRINNCKSLSGNDTSNTTVYIGNQSCIVQSANTTHITCELKGLESGPQPITCNIPGSGNTMVSQNVSVGGVPIVSTIEPSSGGVYGGGTITIDGNGFSANTTVNVGPNKCKVISVSVSNLTCQLEYNPETDYQVEKCNLKSIDSNFLFVY